MKWINKLSDKDFDNLSRNEDGDILNLSNVYYRMTEEQLERLSDDDWSRVNEYELEMEYLKMEIKNECA